MDLRQLNFSNRKSRTFRVRRPVLGPARYTYPPLGMSGVSSHESASHKRSANAANHCKFPQQQGTRLNRAHAYVFWCLELALVALFGRVVDCACYVANDPNVTSMTCVG
jgi:hypothetical protein